MDYKFKINDIVLYQNGMTFELGVVKECLIINNEPCYRVWYHTGDTAAVTHESLLHKIINDYAFLILRRKADTVYIQDTPARQLANRLLNEMEELVGNNFSEQLFTVHQSDDEEDDEEWEGLLGDIYLFEDKLTQVINDWKNTYE